jgi:hypothetical protein
MSERFVHECLDDKYKQKHRVENARKRKNKEEAEGNEEENLAALPLLNQETEKRLLLLTVKEDP